MKKIISLTLSLIMIMTTLCAMPFSAKATTDEDLQYVSLKTNKNFYMAGDKLQLFLSKYDKDGNKLGSSDHYKIVNESWKVNGGATKYTNATPWSVSDPALYIVNDNDFYYDYECYLTNNLGVEWPGYISSSSQINKLNDVDFPFTGGTSYMYADAGFAFRVSIRFYKTVVDGKTVFYPVGLPCSITAPTKAGMKFVKWTGEYGPSSNLKALTFANEASATTTFTMPGISEGVVTITSVYEKEASKETPVAKKANTLAVKAKKPSVKFKKLKKKNQSLALKKWATVSNAKGAVSYKLISAKKGKKNFKKKFKIAKNGKITVKKGLKKGTYKVKIQVTAAGNTEYNAAVKTVTVKIKVK